MFEQYLVITDLAAQSNALNFTRVTYVIPTIIGTSISPWTNASAS